MGQTLRHLHRVAVRIGQEDALLPKLASPGRPAAAAARQRGQHHCTQVGAASLTASSLCSNFSVLPVWPMSGTSAVKNTNCNRLGLPHLNTCLRIADSNHTYLDFLHSIFYTYNPAFDVWWDNPGGSRTAAAATRCRGSDTVPAGCAPTPL